MRPIKFRGIDWETGEYVYGDLIQGNYDEVCPRIKPRKKKARYVKDVAQLVGYDKNGNEVYEGDRLINKDGSECEALYQPTLYVPKDALSVPIAFGQRLITLTLKEAD